VIRNTRCSKAAFALAAVLCLGTAGAQVAPWQNDWTVLDTPSLRSSAFYASTPQAPVVTSPDGEMLMRTATLYRDDQLTRFTTSGAVRWTVNIGSIGGTDDPAAGPMIANADGSAFAATQYGAAVVRIDATGTIVWSTAVGVESLILSGQQLVVQDCHAVTALDPVTGHLKWQYGLPGASFCGVHNGAADNLGNIYAVLNSGVLKLSATGQLLWQRPITGATVVVGTPDSTVYVQTVSGSFPTLVAVNATDGTLRWNNSGGAAIAVVGSPGEPLTGGYSVVSRLSASDGSVRWSQSLPNPLDQTTACSHGAKTTVGASQLNVDTGAIDWTAGLVTQDAFGNALWYFNTQCNADGSTTFVASTSSGAPPRLTRVDSAGVPLVIPVIPPAEQGVSDDVVVPAANSVVAIAEDDNALGPALRLRAVERNGGVLRWETHRAPQPFVSIAQPGYGLAANDDIAVATMRANLSSASQSHWVGAFEMNNGALRWESVLSDTDPNGERAVIAEAPPLLDPAGDVILAYTVEILNDTLHTQHEQVTVLKLSRIDGSHAWRHDEVFPDYPLGLDTWINSPIVTLLGSDVLLTSPFAAPNEGKTLLKLSGADGSALWYSDVFSDVYGVYGAYPTDDGNVVVLGSNRWGKLDAQTGVALWGNVNNSTCVSLCGSGGGVQVLSDGDLLFVGQNASRAEITVLPGYAGAAPQRWLLDQDDTNLRQSYFWGLQRDAAGGIWTRIQRNYLLYDQRIGYLAKLDPATGSVLSQQAMYGRDGDALLPWISPLLLAAPENNRLLAETFHNQPPAPYTTGVALLDTTITANGNLSVQFTTSRAKASPGQQVGFHLMVNYSGDAPVSGARLIADFPWTGHAQGVICGTTGASNCVLDPRSDTIVATFDIQPGGRVDITGWIHDTDVADPAQLSAIVVGPIGLNELVTADNAARATVDQSLFFDGFE
jgi:hypothetical protein